MASSRRDIRSCSEMESGEYQDRVLLPLEVQKNGLGQGEPAAQPGRALQPAPAEHARILRCRAQALYRRPAVAVQSGRKRNEIIAVSYKAQVAYCSRLGQRWEVPYDQRLELVEGTRILPNAQPDAQIAAKVMVACPDIIEMTSNCSASLAQSNHTVDQVVMSYVDGSDGRRWWR